MINVPILNSSPAMEAFRTNVKRLVDDGKISVSEIARRSGMSRPSLSRMLNGEEVVSIPRAEAISHAVGVELAKLIA